MEARTDVEWLSALRNRRYLCPDLRWSNTSVDERAAKAFAVDNRFCAANATDLVYEEPAMEQAFRDWCHQGSWAICPTCSVLHPRKLTQRALDRPRQISPWEHCGCGPKSYVAPAVRDIPVVLIGLSTREIRLLRPFVLHQGDMPKRPNGYRVHDQRSRLSWKAITVSEDLAQSNCRSEVLQAYQYLSVTYSSHYKYYLDKHAMYLQQRPEVFSLPAAAILWPCIECALWPHLYPYSTWSDVSINRKHRAEAATEDADDGSDEETDHRSMKASFTRKAFCEILDYASDASLAQFQFDAYMFRTIMGTKAQVFSKGCSHQNASDHKNWTPAYMKWHHASLMDVSEQLGDPDIFGTITVNEWEFPLHAHVQDAMQKLMRTHTNLPAYECSHHAHVLTQTVLGLICGKTGDKPTKWREHLVGSACSDVPHNCRCCFLHLEYQAGERASYRALPYHGRGTVHVHFLIWLRNLKWSHLDCRLFSSLVNADARLAALATRLQCNPHKPVAMKAQESPHEFRLVASSHESRLQRWILLLHYPGAAVKAGLRVCFKAVLRVLRSHSDILLPSFGDNNNALVLQYASRYATKFAEGKHAFYDESDLGPEATARRLLDQFHPLEPQMWHILTRTPIARCTWKTKRLRPPLPLQENEHHAWSAYLARDAALDETTMLIWARTHHTEGSKLGQPYQHDWDMAVGIRYSSAVSDLFFGQWLCMNVSHRAGPALMPAMVQFVPASQQYFAACLMLCPETWRCQQNARKIFAAFGHRKDYLDDLMTKMIADIALIDHCLRTQIPRTLELAPFAAGPLVGKQLLGWARCKQQLQKRVELYEDYADELHWENICGADKAGAILGGPGSGKTYTILHCIKTALDLGLEVAVFTPAAKLQELFRAAYPSISIDTVHAGFGVPVDDQGAAWPVNLFLSRYGLVVVDEISMLTERIVEHIGRTWKECNKRFVLQLCGDFNQLEPVGGIQTVGNALSSNFWKNSVSVTGLPMSAIGRCKDVQLLGCLRKVASGTLSSTDVQDLTRGRWLGPFSVAALQSMYKNHPDAVVLAFSNKKVDEANKAAASILHRGKTILGKIRLATESSEDPEYLELVQGHKIVIGYNYSKAAGAVNGAEAVVEHVGAEGVRVRLAAGQPYVIPARHDWEDLAGMAQLVRRFHIRSGYAMTVHKAQGLTLRHVCLYFECQGTLPCGLGYVALSRVARLDNLHFMGRIVPEHFRTQSLVIDTD